MQDGYDEVCDMGTCDSSIHRFLNRLLIFHALEAHFNLSNRHMVTCVVYEGNQASKIEPQNKAKDDASIINVAGVS